MSNAHIHKDNELRKGRLFSLYDPIDGIGSPLDRIDFPLNDNYTVKIPAAMKNVREIGFVLENGTLEYCALSSGVHVETLTHEFVRLRCKHDFEFWAATCVTIKTKRDGMRPFVLNRPQRKLLKELEIMRLAGVPIRIILLKSRQWGGSTLTQLYMAWIQLFHKRSWNSMVIADVKDKARHITAMFELMARKHPEDIVPGIQKIQLAPYQQTQNFREIVGLDNIIGVTSVETPDAPRSFTMQMLHLSEVGLWSSTPKVNAEDLAQSLHGGLVKGPYTLCVMESTGKGVGNFFHRAWQDAVRGVSNDVPVFVAWWEDADCMDMQIDDPVAFVDSWDEYEKELWDLGATIEHVHWYRSKKKDIKDEWRLKAEFPSTPEEAFQSTGHRYFPIVNVLKARKTCKQPIAIGELHADGQKYAEAFKNIEFHQQPEGKVRIWTYPGQLGLERKGKVYANRYCAFADIGGRHKGADYSSVTVIDRIMTLWGGVPYVAAEFHGHLDQDLFAWYAGRMAQYYNRALLAIEVNSLRRLNEDGDVQSEHSMTVIDLLKDYYDNLYYRTTPEKTNEGFRGILGFHTNKLTKPMILDTLNEALRDDEYEERNLQACDEFDYYEVKPDGTFGAVEGQHDDRVISRAGALWLSRQMDPVKEIGAGDAKQFSTAKKGGFGVLT